ncbi:MAG: AbrB/MazE/SpoVT family DNA-binding domain-containing protein [Candidatus Woesebacteria bacterium]|nr:AbrB/MazE/SpoVT family DNA-binding domain-containing protein [Candidatus Woesebacteria bacterium]
MYTVSITSQGQISIPASLRGLFNLKTTNKANIVQTDEGLLIRPVVDFLELAGSLSTNKKPLSNSSIHELFSTSMANRKKRD